MIYYRGYLFYFNMLNLFNNFFFEGKKIFYTLNIVKIILINKNIK